MEEERHRLLFLSFLILSDILYLSLFRVILTFVLGVKKWDGSSTPMEFQGLKISQMLVL